VPVLVGAVQPVVHLVLSGRLMGTSGLAKASRFAWAKETFPVTVLWHDFVLGGWGDHLAQGFGRLVPVTILAGVVRAVRRDGGVLLIACWLAPMVLLSVTLPIAWHHYRYLHLLVPVVAMLVADPVAWALGRCGEAARPAGWVLAACWSMGGAAWADTLAQNAADVRMQHVAMGRWVAAHLPPDARIVAGDVGALTWFGERRFIDLEGIVTPGMLRHAAAGEGSLYARLRALRPTHAVYYGDAWYPGIGAAGAFVEERRAVLVDRTIAGARAMLLGVADPAVFASADAPPRLEAGERWCARVDAADLDSEAAAHWEELPGTRPLGAPAHPVPTRVMRLTAPFGESPIVDDVRRVFGTQVFRVPCGAARGGRLVARLAQQNAPSSFVVGIGGRAVGLLVLPVHATRWIEVSVDLPEGYAGEEIAVVPVEDTPGDAGGLVVARWWRVVGGTPARADAAQASP
jgi:hypothetical protein